MDNTNNFSSEMFENPIVKVGGYQEYEIEIQEDCQAIFGRILTPEDFVELIAAPNGSDLLIEVSQSDESIELKLGYKWFNETHDYLIYVEEGRRIVEIDNVYVKEELLNSWKRSCLLDRSRAFRSLALIKSGFLLLDILTIQVDTSATTSGRV